MKPETEGRGRARRWWRGEVLGGIVTVAVLAVVVFVAGSLSPTGKAPKGEVDNKSTVSRQFAQRAQEALNSGDATLAATLAQRAVDADGSNTVAKSVQSRANAAKSNSSSGSSGASSGTGGSGTSQQTATPKWATKSGANLKHLIPTEIGGYDLSPALLGENEIQTSGTSVERAGQVVQIVWTVREMDSAKAANGFVKRTSKELYGDDSLTLQVDGAQAYFGTDSVRYATCAYVRGIYVFEVLGTSNIVRPSAIKREVVAAAKAFPDKP